MENDLTLRSVSEAGHAADIPLVQRAWSDPDPEIRRTALGSFNRAGELKYPLLSAAFRDIHFTVRRRAAELAARVDLDPTEREQIITRLAHSLDDVDEVAEMAAFALGEIGSAAFTNDGEHDEVPDLPTSTIKKLEEQALKHQDALCREQAVASLGALHSSRDVILEALGDKATVRRRAVIALAPFEGPDVDAALTKALEDRDWQVRQAAEDLLAD